MSYALVIEGLKERFLTIPALNKLNDAGEQVGVLAYEPTSIDPPTLYLLFESSRREQFGQVTAHRYQVLARLALRWQDSEQAELELMPFVNLLGATIDADPQLGGRIGSGIARITETTGVFIKIGDVLYRGLDCIVDVLDKGPFQGGL